MNGFLYRIFPNNFSKNSSFTMRVSIVITVLFFSIPVSSIHGGWGCKCCECDDDYGYEENIPLKAPPPTLGNSSSNPTPKRSSRTVVRQPASTQLPSLYTSYGKDNIVVTTPPSTLGNSSSNLTPGSSGRTVVRQPASTRPSSSYTSYRSTEPATERYESGLDRLFSKSSSRSETLDYNARRYPD